MKIKQIKRLTAEQLLEIEKSECEMFGDGGLNRWTLPVVARYGQLFAAESDEKIISLASFICKEKTAFLIGLWVKEEFRNQGLGTKILSEAIAALKAQNIVSVELTVDKQNKAATSLYQKLGFEESEKLEDFYGPGQSRILLTLNKVC